MLLVVIVIVIIVVTVAVTVTVTVTVNAIVVEVVVVVVVVLPFAARQITAACRAMARTLFFDSDILEDRRARSSWRASVWGFDCSFTNYSFKKTLNLKA